MLLTAKRIVLVGVWACLSASYGFSTDEVLGLESPMAWQVSAPTTTEDVAFVEGLHSLGISQRGYVSLASVPFALDPLPNGATELAIDIQLPPPPVKMQN